MNFWGPNDLLWGSKTVLRSTHVVEQLSISIIASNMTFQFDLFLGSFLNLLGPNKLFWGQSRVRKLVWGLLMELSNFYFLCLWG